MLIRAARTSLVVYIAITATPSQPAAKNLTELSPFFFGADPQLSTYVPKTPDYGSRIWRRWKWSSSLLRRHSCSGSGDSRRTRSRPGSAAEAAAQAAVGDFEIFITIPAEGLIPHCTHLHVRRSPAYTSSLRGLAERAYFECRVTYV
jgi:hypothetical protein